MKLTSKTINYTVDTIEQLLLTTGTENDTVIVTDENQGGVFVYREDNSSTNNGGTIFNGWTRQYDGAVNVKWFGAVGDGVTDDTSAIKSFISYINTGIDRNFEFNGNSTYYIDQTRVTGEPLLDITVSNIIFNGNYSTLQYKKNWHRTSADQTAIYLRFLGANNSIVSNLIIDGGGLYSTKDSISSGSSSGLTIGGCENLTVNNVTSQYNMTDGFYIIDSSGKASKNIIFNNCIAKNNARQGMSIIQLNEASFNNCSFENTGSCGTYGSHSPSAGVDVEPNRIFPNVDIDTGNIAFNNCLFKNNNGQQLVYADNNYIKFNISVNECHFQVDDITTVTYPFITSGGAKLSSFNDCTFTNVGFWPTNSVSTLTSSVTTVDNCTFVSNNSSQILFRVVGPTLVETRSSNNKFFFNSLTPPTSDVLRLQINTNEGYFINNRIFIASTEHRGVAHKMAQIVIPRSEKNEFSTDLTSSYFYIDSNGAAYQNDTFLTPSRLAPFNTSTYLTTNFSRGSSFVSDIRFISSISDRILGFSSILPTTTLYTVGSVYFNSSPIAGGFAGWIYTSTGWKTFGAITA